MKSKILVFFFICTLTFLYSCRIFNKIKPSKESKIIEYVVEDIKDKSNLIFKGNVVDLETKENIPFSHVEMKSLLNTYNFSTDENGNFLIENIKQGTYKIKFSFISYKPYVINEIYIEKGKEIYMQIGLIAIILTQ